MGSSCIRVIYESNKKQDKIDNTIDKLKEKYGYDFITRASELNIEKTVKIKRKD